MPDIPQLNNADPILNPIAVASGAQGQQVIANQFMRAGVTVADTEKRLADLQSQAATYQALTTARKLVTDAQIKIAQSPGQASQIAQSVNETLEHIVNVTPTKKPEELKYNVGNIANALTLHASQTQLKDNLLNLRVQFDTHLQAMLANITQAAVQGDVTGFKSMRANLINNLHAQYASGAMSRREYLKYHDTLDHYDASLSKLSNLKHGDEASHIALANPLLDMGVPHQLARKESATSLADSLHTTNTVNQLTARIAAGQPVDPATFISLKDAKQDLIVDYAKGAAIVNGKLNAGTDFQDLRLRYDYLKTLKNPSPMEQGEMQRMDNVLNRLNAGEFNAVIAQIPDGKRLQDEFQANLAPPPGATQEQADEAAYRARDTYLTKAATLWRSQNGDPSFIRVGAQVASTIESALTNPEVSPAVALKEIGAFSEHNRVYVANSLRNPVHQTATFMLGSLMGKVPQSTLVELVTSMKNYRSNREVQSSLVDTATLRNRIVGFLGENKNELDYLQLTGAQDIRNSIAELQQQYVLDKTIANHGQLDGVREFNDLIKKSFNVTRGDGYIFSLSAMPGVTPAQAELIAHKTLKEAYARLGINYLQRKSVGSDYTLSGGIPGALVSAVKLTSSIAAKLSNYFTTQNVPIRVFNELNGDIKAVDRSGQVLVQHPLTDDYIRSVLE